MTADGDPPGPTQRVSSLMFLRGTCPEEFEPDARESYVMPLLDAGLRAALLAAFAPRPGDHPLMAAEPVDALAAFLDEHDGARLLRTPTEAVDVLLRPGVG